MRARGTPFVLNCSEYKEKNIVQQSNKSQPSLISMTANFLFSLADIREGIKALKTPCTFFEKPKSCQCTVGHSTKHIVLLGTFFEVFF